MLDHIRKKIIFLFIIALAFFVHLGPEILLDKLLSYEEHIQKVNFNNLLNKKISVTTLYKLKLLINNFRLLTEKAILNSRNDDELDIAILNLDYKQVGEGTLLNLSLL